MEYDESDNSPPAQARNVGMLFTVVFGSIVLFLFGIFIRVPEMIWLWCAVCLTEICVFCGTLVQYVLLEGYPQEKKRLLNNITGWVPAFAILLLWLLAGIIALSLNVKISGVGFSALGLCILAVYAIYYYRGNIARAIQRRGPA